MELFAPSSSPASLWARMGLSRANSKNIGIYFRQLHTMLYAGIVLSSALHVLSEEATCAALRRASAEMSREVSAGRSWHQVMEGYPGLFSEMTLSIIRAAEEGGFLERACQILADYSDQEYEIYQAIKRETYYSKLLLFFSTVIVPLPIRISYGGVGHTFDMKEQILIIVGTWLTWKIVNLIWPVGARGGPVREWIDGVRLKLPIAGKTVRALATAKFCRFLGMSYAAGLSLPLGVETAAAACGNVVIAGKMRSTLPRLRQGEPLAETLIATGELSSTTFPLLRSGEMTGDLDDQLQAAARLLEMEAETAMRQTVVALGIGVFLLVAAKIGTQVIQYHAQMAG